MQPPWCIESTHSWQFSWSGKKTTLSGSFSAGHDSESRRQSESSRRTHLNCEREKKRPELQVLATATPAKHMKYLTQLYGFGTFVTPLSGHSTGLGRGVAIVVWGASVFGANSQSWTNCSKTQACCVRWNQNGTGHLCKTQNRSKHVKYDSLRVVQRCKEVLKTNNKSVTNQNHYESDYFEVHRNRVVDGLCFVYLFAVLSQILRQCKKTLSETFWQIITPERWNSIDCAKYSFKSFIVRDKLFVIRLFRSIQ